MNFSIITDYGCPFNCSFCISNSQLSKKDFIFTEDMKVKILENLQGVERVSISGGGDPMFTHNTEIEKFLQFVITETNKLGIKNSIHTNIMSPLNFSYLIFDFDKVVVSVMLDDVKSKVMNYKNIDDVRFTYVSDGTDIITVMKIYNEIPDNCQFTVKQLDECENDFSQIENFMSIDEKCVFLGSGDYNTYLYLNDLKIYEKFKSIKF